MPKLPVPIERKLALELVAEGRQRLQKLSIKNFRCIGANPVEIELDDIVVLVGPNNVGKSSILRAYEIVMSQGSADGKLMIQDFPNGRIDENNLPEIVLHTIVYNNFPGQEWIHEIGKEKIVIERWCWAQPGDPKRQGLNVNGGWDEKVPWGAPGVANSRRPQPHRIGAFDLPEDQAEEITKLLSSVLTNRIKDLKKEEEGSDYGILLSQVKSLQKKIVLESQTEIDKVQDELTNLIGKVFPNYQVRFNAKPEDDPDKAISLFKNSPQLLMGPTGGYLGTIEAQGSGARRTLLWTALQIISESKTKKDKDGEVTRSHVLLLDEPEICLHPDAIRHACNLLYGLPSSNWQVMITTHSPNFIDVSRDNTTIIRVEKNSSGDIKGTTIFRPEKVGLEQDDKKLLKLMNIWDPYVAEFFFGGKVVVVEGDTEYTVFKYIIAKNPEKYSNIHIIRARGKATIVSVAKILNHFGAPYSILHDSDRPKVEKKDRSFIANPAWSKNKDILDITLAHKFPANVRLLASVPNFEEAYFGEAFKKEKPYTALVTIMEDEEKFLVIESLLDSLLDFNVDPPSNCYQWKDIVELEKLIDKLD